MTVIIRMRDVSWARGERMILRDINWEVKEGEQWAILRLNGSGKTSLLNIVTGYQYPTSGDVEVLGYRFGQASLPELRRHIGFVSSALLDQFHDTLQTETVEDVIISGKFATIGLYDAVTSEDPGSSGGIDGIVPPASGKREAIRDAVARRKAKNIDRPSVDGESEAADLGRADRWPRLIGA